jgi:RNA polymerase sigma-70 factor, ECF subfamily
MQIKDFEPLFKSQFNKLCNVAGKIVRDTDVAKDIVQEVFIRVWNKKEELEAGNMEFYLRKATVNAALNHLELNKKVIPLNEEVRSLQLETSDHVTTADLELNVYRAIEKLPTQCRAIFMLSRFEEMKYQEIANHLDISVKTVENQMGKALRDLRVELKPFLTTEFISAVIATGITIFLPYLSLLLLLQSID